ncbi:SipW-cognate class signal peptide [Brevibacterium siliguriense]|uniref:SipW-cognate class signal peptide n=1 Tax=Brevibacterium siliguriense TaxID=1136497 RepID=A0A1H1QTX3_9MICO|nr:SipW-dependent-type signal peptide-containing protein [Brevibacterium siliguriense]SDS26309.1 SipW-cognate class signal peptide [Brevibacterium siliguriense]
MSEKYPTTDQTMTADGTSAPRRRRRKLLAITSGGIVLGIGAAVTLAAWTDREAAKGDFASGSFALESSLDGANFTDTSGAGDALVLTFDDMAENLSPTDTASSVYAIRLDRSSTYSASVSGAVEATGSAADNLSYSVQRVSDISGGTPVGGALVSAEPVTSTNVHEDMFSVSSLGDVVFLKVTVKADSDLGQGESADVTWNLTGTSVDSL